MISSLVFLNSSDLVLIKFSFVFKLSLLVDNYNYGDFSYKANVWHYAALLNDNQTDIIIKILSILQIKKEHQMHDNESYLSLNFQSENLNLGKTLQ